MTGKIRTLSAERSAGVIEAENGLRFPFESTSVLAYDVAFLATGHLVTFDWNRKGDGLFAQVSLFNDLNYKILMCFRYSGLVQNIRTGHHFDLQSRTISALAAATVSS